MRPGAVAAAGLRAAPVWAGAALAFASGLGLDIPYRAKTLVWRSSKDPKLEVRLPWVVERKVGWGGALCSTGGAIVVSQAEGRVARERLTAAVRVGGQAVARLRRSMAVAVRGAAQRPRRRGRGAAAMAMVAAAGTAGRSPAARGVDRVGVGNNRFLSLRDGVRGTQPRRVVSRCFIEFMGQVRVRGLGEQGAEFLDAVPVAAGGGVGG